MSCRPVVIQNPDGTTTTGIVCGPSHRLTRQPCSVPGCFEGAGYLCDYPLAGQARTCDAPLCRHHRRPIRKDRDYCAHHFEAAMRGE